MQLLRAEVKADLEKQHQKSIQKKVYLTQKKKNYICSVILFWEAQSHFREVRLHMLRALPAAWLWSISPNLLGSSDYIYVAKASRRETVQV